MSRARGITLACALAAALTTATVTTATADSHITGPAARSPQAGSAAAAEVYCPYRVKADSTPVRSAARPTAPIVGSLAKGQLVTGSTTSNGFIKIGTAKWVVGTALVREGQCRS
ncbi:hypothetical protein [Streptomyces sp. NPDC007088]|uniref:hypothetical protein n=1 Tax=Streptomyces sp. NPDC007088 TaxID=3364773 RepID=UPI0036C30EEB